MKLLSVNSSFWSWSDLIAVCSTTIPISGTLQHLSESALFFTEISWLSDRYLSKQWLSSVFHFSLILRYRFVFSMLMLGIDFDGYTRKVLDIFHLYIISIVSWSHSWIMFSSCNLQKLFFSLVIDKELSRSVLFQQIQQLLVRLLRIWSFLWSLSHYALSHPLFVPIR